MVKKVLTTLTIVLILLITEVFNPVPSLIKVKFFGSHFTSQKLSPVFFGTQNMKVSKVTDSSLQATTETDDPQILIELNGNMREVYIIKFQSLNKNPDDPWQIYFDRGQGFSERDSIKSKVKDNNEIYLPPYINTKKIKRLRIDPGNMANVYFEISQFEIKGE
ncbi:hypothetical protein [Paenibacillus polymyxa]|uniref:hypothetical protein n=1 Tax=Paenibacillus polymyxa TaxID=1406 RepID=UPI002025A633|nr:hypothetical protein [Paenibacillus polymyxa]URJ59863.1 hypothetical protein MF622_004574 [Paenibacillus polymyxa]